MESIVTRWEFENGLKEVRRMQFFLADTFGSKFMEFFKEGKLVETEQQLLSQFGAAFISNIINTRGKAEPTSQPFKVVNGVVEEPNKNKQLQRLDVPSTSSPTPSFGPIILNTTSVLPPAPTSSDARRKIGTGIDIIPVVVNNKKSTALRTNTVKSVRTVSQSTDSNDLSTPIMLQNLPITIVPTTSTPAKDPLRNTQPEAALTITECITLDDEDNHDRDTNSTTMQSASKNQNKDGVVFSRQSSSNYIQTRSNVNGSLFNSPPSSKRRANDGDNEKNKKHQSSSLSSTTPNIKQKPPSVNTKNDEIIQCKDCQLFIYSSQMVEHVKQHQVFQPKPKLKASSSSKSTPNVSVFDQTFTCPLCYKSGFYFQTYEDHCNTEHPEGKPCPICKKVLSSKSTLRRHMACHENIKFVCDVCGKGYNRRDNLTAHMRLHKDGKVTPYAYYCLYCKCAFASKEGRDKHMDDLHSSDDSTKPLEVNTSVLTSQVQSVLPDLEANDDVENSRGGTSAGELIDIGPEFKVNVSVLDGGAFEFEYEGDEDEEDMC